MGVSHLRRSGAALTGRANLCRASGAGRSGCPRRLKLGGWWRILSELKLRPPKKQSRMEASNADDCVAAVRGTSAATRLKPCADETGRGI